MSRFVIAKFGACAALGTEASGIQAEILAGVSAFEHLLGPRGAVAIAALETIPSGESRPARRRTLLEHALHDLFNGLSWPPGRVALVHASTVDDGDLEEVACHRAREAGHNVVDSRRCELGRAGWFEALLRAGALLSEDACETVVVYASDSLCDAETVARLVRARETLGEDNRDGMIPGEGACVALCCRLDSPLAARPGAIVCEQVAIGREPNPFSSSSPDSEPNISTGLASLFRSLTPSPRVDVVIDCQTGQARFTKEFHTAYLRCGQLMPEPLVRASTAASFGDAGVATGGLALVVAQLELAERTRALVYASDDDGHLGGAIVTRTDGVTALRERLQQLWVQRSSAFDRTSHARSELVEDHLDTSGYLLVDRFDDLVSGQTPWFELDHTERRIQAQLDALALGDRVTIESARAGLASRSTDRRLGSALVACSWLAPEELGDAVCEAAAVLDEDELGELTSVLALATNSGPVIATMLRHESERLRILGLELAAVRSDVTVSEIAACLDDHMLAVRGAAALSLARRGAEAYEAAIIAAAQSEPRCVDFAAALVWQGHPQAVDRLRWLLAQEPALAVESARWLALCGTPSDMREINRRLTRLEPSEALVEVLGTVGLASSVSYLLAALEEDDEDLQIATARSLDRITGADLREQLIDDAGVVEVRRCVDDVRWRDWLEQREHPWPAARLRDGQTWSLRAVWDELRAGTSELARRRLAAEELSLRGPRRIHLDVRGPIAEQLRLIANWTAALGFG